MAASRLQAEELVNTAPLTGQPRRIPVRLVTVDAGGTLVEVTEHIGCESADTQVLQVRIHTPSPSPGHPGPTRQKNLAPSPASWGSGPQLRACYC